MRLDLSKTYLDGLKGVRSFCRNDKIRQTVPYRNNAVSKAVFSQIIVTVMLNKFESNLIEWTSGSCLMADVFLFSEK